MLSRRDRRPGVPQPRSSQCCTIILRHIFFSSRSHHFFHWTQISVYIDICVLVACAQWKSILARPRHSLLPDTKIYMVSPFSPSFTPFLTIVALTRSNGFTLARSGLLPSLLLMYLVFVIQRQSRVSEVRKVEWPTMAKYCPEDKPSSVNDKS